MATGGFFPAEPASISAAGLTNPEVEGLILKFLMNRGDVTGRGIAAQVKLPMRVLVHLLQGFKDERLVGYSGSAPGNDFVYRITDTGRERAREESRASTYYGAAPVPLADYVASVRAQALGLERPTPADLRRAFDGLLLNDRMLARLGPAITSGRAMFLYGPSGNGKTSIAARLAAAYHEELWIPRAISISGTIVRLFDPVRHVELPAAEEPYSGAGAAPHADARWVRIRRPTIMAGGELTMAQLEVTVNPVSGIAEAPLQLKSNCGALVIDDFGRQRMHVGELLNRWIVPLESRHDYLFLADGKSVEVPFEQFVVFSTNLEPSHLVDEAFLRRIPYKVMVGNPTEEEFQELFRMVGEPLGVLYRREAVESLMTRHYRPVGRPLRFCHPRDLLLQVVNYCQFLGRAPEMSDETFEAAVENYFVG
ncbi:MAG: hypothetical protein WCF12_02535 [Propionicimonas sp.]